MKKEIQPKYEPTKMNCLTCGAEFVIGSTAKDIKVDTCANCHPFYTGTQTFAQAQGRVEKFNRRYGLKQNQNKKTVKEEE